MKFKCIHGCVKTGETIKYIFIISLLHFKNEFHLLNEIYFALSAKNKFEMFDEYGNTYDRDRGHEPRR